MITLLTRQALAFNLTADSFRCARPYFLPVKKGDPICLQGKATEITTNSPNLVPNGDFDTTDDWTTGGSAWSIADNKL
ncbi:MAG TPA: hypothetical protein VG603_15940, partial [Chitinophagales bacterium]|nr:hypothetical protein [Chitinophagales bacterium]